MHELYKNRMVPKIAIFHYLGLKELKCAVVCYFQVFTALCDNLEHLRFTW